MKLTASKYVNARVGSPSTNQENPFYLELGATIDVQEVCIGTMIDSNSIWFKDEMGHFYWSGGFAEKGIDQKLFDPVRELTGKEVFFKEGLLHSLLPEFIEKYDNEHFTAITVEDDTIVISVEDNKNISEDLCEDLNFRGYRVAVRVKVAGNFSPNKDPYYDSGMPLVMGGTIANVEKVELGTRGLKLEYNGSTIILTCFHVACNSLLSQSKDEYDQTAVRVQFPAKASLGSMKRSYGRVIQGKVGGFFDYAFVSVPVANMISGNLFENEAPVEAYSGFDNSQLKTGDEVIAYGAINGKREGTIKRIYPANAYVTVDYPGIGSTRVNGMIETTKISEHGDSGAAVTDSQNKVIGILIASNAESSLVMPFCRLTNVYTLKLLS